MNKSDNMEVEIEEFRLLLGTEDSEVDLRSGDGRKGMKSTW